jgi:hypothetical protein
MSNKLITIDLTIVPSFCNQWPQIEIEANDQTVWKDYVTQESTISVDFLAQEQNTVRIKYTNKRNGPDTWDTTLDENGAIVQDQNAVLTNVRINRAQANWLIATTVWNYTNGEQKQNYGFMDLQGYMEINFPSDVYTWIIQQRRATAPQSEQTSSLDYKNIYIPQHENEMSRQLIEEIKQKISQLNV